MSRFIEAVLMFLLVLAACLVGFSVVFGIVWIWTIGLMSLTNGFQFALYLIATFAVIPAVAITHTIMEDYR